MNKFRISNCGNKRLIHDTGFMIHDKTLQEMQYRCTTVNKSLCH